jgi:hypothetical protein
VLHILGNNKEGDKQKFITITADCDIFRNDPETKGNKFEPRELLYEVTRPSYTQPAL